MEQACHALGCLAGWMAGGLAALPLPRGLFNIFVLGTSQPASQPTSQPATQPASQPANQPASPPAGQPANQPASQPASNLVNFLVFLAAAGEAQNSLFVN